MHLGNWKWILVIILNRASIPFEEWLFYFDNGFKGKYFFENSFLKSVFLFLQLKMLFLPHNEEICLTTFKSSMRKLLKPN